MPPGVPARNGREGAGDDPGLWRFGRQQARRYGRYESEDRGNHGVRRCRGCRGRGVNVGIATTTAKVGKGRTIASAGGALKVQSTNQTDASAKADGSQVDPGNTDVGVGAAVALNVGISTNTAVVGENATINAGGSPSAP